MAIDFSRLFLFTVVLPAPHHQPYLRVRAWDRHKYHFLFPVARCRGVHEAEISIQISALAAVLNLGSGSLMAPNVTTRLPHNYTPTYNHALTRNLPNGFQSVVVR